MGILDLFKRKKPVNSSSAKQKKKSMKNISAVWLGCPACGRRFELRGEQVKILQDDGVICRCGLTLGKSHSDEEIEIAKRIAHIQDLLDDLSRKNRELHPYHDENEQLENETFSHYWERTADARKKYYADIESICIAQVKSFIQSGEYCNNEYFEFHQFIHDKQINLPEPLQLYFDNTSHS